MRYGSVCSGIEAATVAWHKTLGWEPAFFSEIEAFPRAVLQHHYPDVPLHGDFTTIKGDEYGSIDLLCGGTPCQSFSIAGLRKGLADERGNLTREFVRLAARTRARWLVWENVPGVLSSNRGRDFASFLGGLAECGYGFAYRVLDAQYFGVPQRRRRVVLVAYLGDWRPAAAVLFERESLRRDITPGREARESVTGGFETGPHGGGFIEISPTLDARCKDGPIRNQIGAGVVSASVTSKWAKGSGGPAGDECQNLVAVFDPNQITSKTNRSVPAPELSHALPASSSPPHAFKIRGGCEGGGKGYLGMDEQAFTVATGQDQNLMHNMAVRRLTPRECERLQGFPDDYTLVPKKVIRVDTSGKCAKQEVTATIVSKKGVHYIGTNACEVPQTICPRGSLPSGEGYHLCKEICRQEAHAEVIALKLAGNKAKKATLYLEGHTHVCANCQAACDKAGIRKIVYGKAPGTCADGPRYKAIGNSWAVPKFRWLGERIQMVEDIIKGASL